MCAGHFELKGIPGKERNTLRKYKYNTDVLYLSFPMVFLSLLVISLHVTRLAAAFLVFFLKKTKTLEKNVWFWTLRNKRPAHKTNNDKVQALVHFLLEICESSFEIHSIRGRFCILAKESALLGAWCLKWRAGGPCWCLMAQRMA